MITVEQILAAEGEELSRLLGEVLQPEGTHNLQGDTSYDKKVNCGKCGKAVFDIDHPANEDGWGWLPAHREPCLSNPIPLNWDNSMKWRDWAVKEYGEIPLSFAMKAVFNAETGRHNSIPVHLDWFSTFAEPKHYLQAAAICKLNAEKGDND